MNSIKTRISSLGQLSYFLSMSTKITKATAKAIAKAAAIAARAAEKAAAKTAKAAEKEAAKAARAAERAAAKAAKGPLRTEDTGKILEMAVCLAYGIGYDGKYKYGLEEPTALKPRLAALTALFPPCVHTAKRGARYDFTAPGRHLSVKSTKGNTMVAPQCVGQAQPAKFCERLGLPTMEVPVIQQPLVHTDYSYQILQPLS